MSFFKKLFSKTNDSVLPSKTEETATSHTATNISEGDEEATREQKQRIRNAESLKFDGLRLLRAGYVTQALEYLARSVELNPEFENRYYYASALTRLGKNSEAIEIYKSLSQEAPEHTSLHLSLLNLLVTEERYAEASECFTKTSALSLDDAEEALLRFYEAMLAVGEEDYDRAIEAADRSLSLQADHPRVALYKTKALLLANRLEEAESWIKDMRQRFPEEERFALYAATIAAERRQPEKEEKALKEAIDIDPFNEEAHLRLAALYETQGHIEAAIALLSPFYEEEHATVRMKQCLADLYRKQDNPEKADKVLESINEEDIQQEGAEADFSSLYTNGLY